MTGGIHAYQHPYVCTDAVIFKVSRAVSDDWRKGDWLQLNVLLYERKEEPFNGLFCLPGGFLSIDEIPEANVCRKVKEKVGVACEVEQIHAFCGIDRDPRGRVISLVYRGLFPVDAKVNINQSDEYRTGWFEVWRTEYGVEMRTTDMFREVIFTGYDHNEMIAYAVDGLQANLLANGLIFRLLPKKFTLGLLQGVYEAVMGFRVDAPNFRRFFNGLLTDTGEKEMGKGHRPGSLYRVNPEGIVLAKDLTVKLARCRVNEQV